MMVMAREVGDEESRNERKAILNRVVAGGLMRLEKKEESHEGM